jgi:hypothetical protein
MSTLHRSRKDEQRYAKYLKHHVHANDICVFCEIDSHQDQIVKEYPLFRVLVNKFAYSVWDSSTVTEHLIVVPIRHIPSLSDFTPEEVIEHHQITSEHEDNGYDVYTRGAHSNMKSVIHVHTHLLKTDGKKIKGLIYLQKPLIRSVIK